MNLLISYFVRRTMSFGTAMEWVNATQQFLGDDTQWPAARIELFDVQGLWGGRRILVDGTKRVVVQIVDPAMKERRYECALQPDELKGLWALFVENDFLTIRPAERAGIPDEARPRIRLVNEAGDEREVAKWSGVADERFDRLYQALLRLETLAQRGKPMNDGPSTPGK